MVTYIVDRYVGVSSSRSAANFRLGPFWASVSHLLKELQKLLLWSTPQQGKLGLERPAVTIGGKPELQPELSLNFFPLILIHVTDFRNFLNCKLSWYMCTHIISIYVELATLISLSDCPQFEETVWKKMQIWIVTKHQSLTATF